MLKPKSTLTALVALAALSAGCGSTSRSRPTVATQPVAAGSTISIVMKSLAFNPATVRATVGQTVVWTNRDSAPHNVIYESGPKFRSSRPVLRLGQKFSIRLTQPGTIHYFCSIHPFMQATIVVSP